MDREKLYRIRANNLRKLLDSRFNGDNKAFANKIGSQIVTITKYLNPASDRPCKTRAARKIEQKLNLATGFLDSAEQGDKDIFYIGLYIDTCYTFETIRALQDEPAVVECSCVLGDFDIFLKVEIEHCRYLDMLLARIIKMPEVQRTLTLSSVKSLHWQREQAEDMDLQAKNKALHSNNGIEEFISKKVNFHFNEIKALEKGEVIIKDSDNPPLKHCQIIKGAKKNLLFTITPKQRRNLGLQLLHCEKRLIAEGVQSKRIIFLCHAYDEIWIEIEGLYKRFTNIGSEVRFAFLDDWIDSPSSSVFESYTIVDNKFTCIRYEERMQFLIKRDTSIIASYIDSFYLNWASAYSFEEIKTMML